MTSLESLADIDALYEGEKKWTTTSIVLNVVDDIAVHPRTSSPVNIAQFIGKRSEGGRPKIGAKKIYFADFNDHSETFREKVMFPAIKNACRLDGFYAVSRGYEGKRKRVRIVCNRATRFRPGKTSKKQFLHALLQADLTSDTDEFVAAPLNDGESTISNDDNSDNNSDSDDMDDTDDSENGSDTEGEEAAREISMATTATSPQRQRRTKTNRPVCRKDQCSFQIPFYWDNEANYWFVYEHSAGCLHHCGHCRKLPGEVKVSLRELSEDDLQLAKNLFNVFVGASTAEAFLKERTGHLFSLAQMNHVRSRHQALTLSAAGSDQNLHMATPADRLLHLLECNPTCSFIVLTADWDTSLLTVSRVGQQATGQPRPVRTMYHGPGPEHPAQEILVDDSTLCDATDSALDYATRVRNALLVSGSGGKILLAVAWTTHEARALLAKFPESIVADVHMGTNTEKRPMMIITGKTATNKTFTATHVLMGNAGKFMFQWVWKIAHRTLHSPKAIERTRACATDGDQNEYLPFIELCGINRLYKRATWRLCAWHKIDRGLRAIAGLANATPEARAYFRVIYKWLLSFTDSIESKSEYEDSYDKLRQFLKLPFVSEALGLAYTQKVEEFLLRSFFVDDFLKGLLFLYRKHVRDFGLRTTSNAEAEGGALKRHALGPRPNHTLDRCVAATIKVIARKHARQNAVSATALDSTWISYYKDPTYSKLTPAAASHLKHQFDESSNYYVFCPANDKFYVKRKWYRSPTNDIHDPLFYQYVVPSYERTRIVEVRETQVAARRFSLWCSCGYFDRYGVVCRHQYAVLRRGESPARPSPVISDVAVRWQALYSYYYGRPGREEFTQAFDKAYENEAYGAHVSHAWLQANYKAGEGDKSEPFYLCTLETEPVVLRDSNWWTRMEGSDVSGLRTRAKASCDQPFGLDQHVKLSSYAESTQHEWEATDPDGSDGCWDLPQDDEADATEDTNSHISVVDRAPSIEGACSATSFLHQICAGSGIQPPERDRLEMIQKDVIDKRLQYESLQPLVVTMTTLCTNAEAYYLCAEMVKGIHGQLEAFLRGSAVTSSVSEALPTPEVVAPPASVAELASTTSVAESVMTASTVSLVAASVTAASTTASASATTATEATDSSTTEGTSLVAVREDALTENRMGIASGVTLAYANAQGFVSYGSLDKSKTHRRKRAYHERK